jgi:5'-3' exonuclease
MAQRRLLRENTDKFCSALETALGSGNLSDEQRIIVNERIQTSRRSVPQIRAEDRNEVKQLLYATGTTFVHSLGEADALLAYMEHRGDIDAVISTDYDFLARGVKNLLVPTSENLEGTAFHCFNLAAICEGLGLTEQQFKEFACLLGTDYAPGLVYQRGLTSRLLYRRFKVLGSLDLLMSKMKLPDEKKADVSRSLAELDVSGRGIGELLRSDQQERLAKKTEIEPDWIARHLATNSVCDGIRGFLETKVGDGLCEI